MTSYFKINTQAFGKMTDEEFFQFCRDNELLRIERDANQNIVIMAPTGSEMGIWNSEILFLVKSWMKTSGTGYVFDSSTGFTLPNNAVRSPDVSVVKKSRWNKLSKNDKQKFAPVCPDFIIELISPSDETAFLKNKMKEYINNGCQLGWLIDPQKKQVWIFDHQKKEPELQVNFEKPLEGKYLMKGFEMNLNEVFKEI